ncbi:putative galactofuranosyltransferase [Leptomonas seymouri]|uniref:Putative galactofuranosyltransferase n=1 Tax=Leptomonas seymouri TaxID=5684 RepID=A0A0N1IGZ1_LEPSE|nr:putative galactofuranosyltransferase [Leptomonas seymouri]|eukprot:KPI82442.1 putative galactofuranosyltransferase [Leptomonas seymouri]
MDHSAFWGWTRLAIEVTGYFDENCYPIYYEDTDYMRRMWLLGFKPFLPEGWKGPPMLHFSGGSIVSVKGFVPAPQFADVPPFVRGSKYVIEMQYSMLYILSKYNLHGYQFPDSANKEPHDGRHLPLDVYVLNEERNRAIFELQRLAVWYYSTDKADAALGARSPLAYARLRNATFLHKFVGKMLDGASYYRDGNALRLRPSLA